MTLVLAATGRESIWLVVDRRLTYPDGRLYKDDAVKTMIFETVDGVGLLGYAGLGATAKRTEPSAWMSAVLRGRVGLRFEEGLAGLSEVAYNEIPRHLGSFENQVHSILIPAIVEGLGAQIYSIGIFPGKGVRLGRAVFDLPGKPAYRLAAAGTGGAYLDRLDPEWRRRLLNLIKAFERGRVSELAVARQLAALNTEASENVPSVGGRSIVSWRAPGSSGTGGGTFYFTGNELDSDSPSIPLISRGLDLAAIFTAIQPPLGEEVTGRSILNAMRKLDIDEVNRRLSELPSEPDEWLR